MTKKNHETHRKLWAVVVVALMIIGLLPVPEVPVVHAATFTVNSLDDTDDGSCDATHCSLREAINAANASAADDTITFSVSGTIHLNTGLVILAAGGALTINGSGRIHQRRSQQ